MAGKIRIRRGSKADLPTLSVGEFGYALDTKELTIGGLSGNDLISSPTGVGLQGETGLQGATGLGGSNDGPNDYYVPAQFSTIQEAIDKAHFDDGHTSRLNPAVIFIAPGYYNENLTLRAGVDLKGTGIYNSASVEGTVTYETVIDQEGNDLNIENLAIRKGLIIQGQYSCTVVLKSIDVFRDETDPNPTIYIDGEFFVFGTELFVNPNHPSSIGADLHNGANLTCLDKNTGFYHNAGHSNISPLIRIGDDSGFEGENCSIYGPSPYQIEINSESAYANLKHCNVSNSHPTGCNIRFSENGGVSATNTTFNNNSKLADNPPPPGPVSTLLVHFDFDFFDTSGKSNSIWTHGNVELVPGKFGNGAYYNNIGFNELPEVTEDYDFGSGNWTIEMWIKPLSFSPGELNTLIARGKSVTSSPPPDTFDWFLAYMDGTGADDGLYFGWNNSSIIHVPESQTANILNGDFHHVAVVRNGSGPNSLKIYWDGAIIAQATPDPAINFSFVPLTIGAGFQGDNPVNDMIIDEVRINNSAIYTGAFTPPTEPFPDGQIVAGNLNISNCTMSTNDVGPGIHVWYEGCDDYRYDTIKRIVYVGGRNGFETLEEAVEFVAKSNYSNVEFLLAPGDYGDPDQTLIWPSIGDNIKITGDTRNKAVTGLWSTSLYDVNINCRQIFNRSYSSMTFTNVRLGHFGSGHLFEVKGNDSQVVFNNCSLHKGGDNHTDAAIVYLSGESPHVDLIDCFIQRSNSNIGRGLCIESETYGEFYLRGCALYQNSGPDFPFPQRVTMIDTGNTSNDHSGFFIENSSFRGESLRLFKVGNKANVFAYNSTIEINCGEGEIVYFEGAGAFHLTNSIMDGNYAPGGCLARDGLPAISTITFSSNTFPVNSGFNINGTPFIANVDFSVGSNLQETMENLLQAVNTSGDVNIFNKIYALIDEASNKIFLNSWEHSTLGNTYTSSLILSPPATITPFSGGTNGSGGRFNYGGGTFGNPKIQNTLDIFQANQAPVPF